MASVIPLYSVNVNHATIPFGTQGTTSIPTALWQAVSLSTVKLFEASGYQRVAVLKCQRISAGLGSKNGSKKA